MPLYRYTAVSKAGEFVEGQLDAPDRQSLARLLEARDLLPVRANTGSNGSLWELLNRDVVGGGVSREQVTLLARELSTLLGAGLTVDRALDVLADVSVSPASARLVRGLRDDVRSGRSLAEALSGHRDVFDQPYVAMVRAGEEAGALDVVLGRLAIFLEQADAVRSRVHGALLYPLILVGFACLTIVVLTVFVVPEFEALFANAGATPPFAIRALSTSADLAVTGWWALLIAVAVFLLGWRWLRSRPSTALAIDRFKLGLPIFGRLITRIEAARLARMLATLTGNGVPLLVALGIAREAVRNRVVAETLGAAASGLRRGQGFADSLATTEVLPRLLVHMVRIGEETGHLEAMLAKTSEIYDQEIERITQRLLTMLVPVVTLVLGLLIAVIIGSVLTAVLSINDLVL